MMITKKVLIVGAGPVGLFLANDLVRYGIDIKIIDKLPCSSTFTKALTINSASLKVIQGLGIVEEFLAKGKVLTEAEIYFNGRKTARVNKKYLDSAHNYFLSIPQPVTETILQKELNKRGIYVSFHQELVDLVQNSDYAEASIHDLTNNVINKERFDFIIGCDGAHSTVRKLAGLSFAGHDYDMYFVIGDVYFEDNCQVEKSTYFLDKGGFVGTFLMSNGYTRLVIRKDGFLPKQKPEVKKEEMQAYLDQHLVNKPLKIKELGWSSSAQIITRVTETGRVNRVFIAGDSYHLFSPVGGHNMNTGFQDAFNLGWKLAYYMHGWANEALLDTYSHERGVAIQKLLASTDLNTQMVMGRNKTHEKIEYFKPKFSNRTWYRHQLPYELAGYFADYSKNDDSLVGKHVPYVKFTSDNINVESTYDLPVLKKFIIFGLDLSLEDLYDYRKILKIVNIKKEDKNIINKLKLSHDDICIIRPDGFIGFHGKPSQALLYFKQYYLVYEHVT